MDVESAYEVLIAFADLQKERKFWPHPTEMNILSLKNTENMAHEKKSRQK